MTVPTAVGDIVASRYRVERILGKGGMGVVVAARHVHLDETVAIKFPLPKAMMNRDLVARVVREGRAAAKLRGEHIARVMDVGTLDSGEPFLVFEYLRGSDLEALLDSRGRIPLKDALEYLLQACEALAEAHAHGIIHRDLKPANLFLTRRPDGTPSIKIIDFGIAKARDTDSDHPIATESFMIFGTPLYMSPEQMRSSKDVDARSDIWSLGAVLHHLLAGTPPFPPRSLPEIYRLAHLGAPPIRSLCPDIPESIEAILLKCMSVDPADRYADVAQLAAALSEHATARAAVSAERASRILSVKDSARDGAGSQVALRAEAITPATPETADRVLPEGFAPTLQIAEAPEQRSPTPDLASDNTRALTPEHIAAAETRASTPEHIAAAETRASVPDRTTPPALETTPEKSEQRASERSEKGGSPRLLFLVAAALAVVAAVAAAWAWRSSNEPTGASALSGSGQGAGSAAGQAALPGGAQTGSPEPLAGTSASQVQPAVVTPVSAVPAASETAVPAASETAVTAPSVAPSSQPSGSARPLGARPGPTGSKPRTDPLDDPN